MIVPSSLCNWQSHCSCSLNGPAGTQCTSPDCLSATTIHAGHCTASSNPRQPLSHSTGVLLLRQTPSHPCWPLHCSQLLARPCPLVLHLRHNDAVAAVLALVQHAHLLCVLVSEQVEVVPHLLHLRPLAATEVSVSAISFSRQVHNMLTSHECGDASLWPCAMKRIVHEQRSTTAFAAAAAMIILCLPAMMAMLALLANVGR
jgi:hypothetical protein